jgi:AcrR family transcriptional regulator
MTTAKPERLSADERRKRIEMSATQLFAERGYAATTVEDIVSAAGVTKPMLYRHFESKRDLCVALLVRYRDELVAAPLARFDPGASDPHAHLASMIGAWLDHALANPAATRLLFTPIRGDRDVERAQLELHDRQRATQAALLREFAPDLTEADLEPMAELARSGLAAIGLWWIEHPEVPRERVVGVTRRMFEGLIGLVRDPHSADPIDAKATEEVHDAPS